MEEAIGRYLSKEEKIHHVNRIKIDNRIENLMLFSNTNEHAKYHSEQKILNYFLVFLIIEKLKKVA
jgi:hypothetical protein